MPTEQLPELQLCIWRLHHLRSSILVDDRDEHTRRSRSSLDCSSSVPLQEKGRSRKRAGRLPCLQAMRQSIVLEVKDRTESY